ncbi:type-F conjugative transfer system pilin assembly thiol-disulfide isomerase TrbB [Legionella sp. 16cNR16C]|uniref:type-F conjugative transfer system pilin assembly thiol-disulfide isomerase TrbB n=1 Tax=Legionella sp. 16cNR16C TaxID=2905656 RepID=UPI001E32D132|nr:type-F conjugative transfer system pilin assembly thiol-disulfide isomerase TrbB [Legionella sp. 16cNR16C]MCE3045406.1 type-F conjugative transfer system pilin assembly thiol-disulfide isomerase TrbB [Legionella sp. 16cNR16C]
MMSARLVLSVVLAFVCLNVSAQGSQWLTQLIAQHEGGGAQQLEKPLNPQGLHFFDTHGFVLFYGSECPHCRLFAPVLKSWAARHKAAVLPLALDNQPLPEFPQFLPATTEWINAAFGGNAINYPALFVVNPKTNALYPVGFGSMTETELNERMEALILKIKAYELKGGV